MRATKQRFKIILFENPRTGSKAWRVTGIKRDGTRIRENYESRLSGRIDAGQESARCRQVELEAEFLAREPEGHRTCSTRLTDQQIHLAELAFAKLPDDTDMPRAIDFWLSDGKARAVSESPKLDEAGNQFMQWLGWDEASKSFLLNSQAVGRRKRTAMRELTKRNLRTRVNAFLQSTANIRVNDITPELIENYFSKRKASARSLDNDRRAISWFIGWCIDRPRRWATSNPCAVVRLAKEERDPVAVLSIEECKKLLKAAQAYKDGALVPYVAVCLYAGLRPFEASRLTWAQVNLADNEIRLEAHQTKTGDARVVSIVPAIRDNGNSHAGPKTLKRWLEAYRGLEFFPVNWRKDFDVIKEQAGYGSGENLKPWPVDVLRHTAISHFFRLTGSYGQTAEQFGNSEAIIKKHYQGKVTTKDTKTFFSILPKGAR